MFPEEDHKPGQERRVQLGLEREAELQAVSVFVTKFSFKFGSL